MPESRKRTLDSVCRLNFQELMSREFPIPYLQELAGIGPWTASFLSVRVLSDPDAFPASDLGLCRAMGLTPRALESRATAWRPWRAYAAMSLWMTGSSTEQS